jgi:hypothetical protein
VVGENWPLVLITLRGETTKSKKTRVVPIATERLGSVLRWLRRDTEGNQKSAETSVFSNEVGEPYGLMHRTWQGIVLRAHGIIPKWGARLCGAYRSPLLPNGQLKFARHSHAKKATSTLRTKFFKILSTRRFQPFSVPLGEATDKWLTADLE